MGLDTVALVMAVEEEFSIEISNDDAETIITVGDLYDRVMANLTDGEHPWSHQHPEAVWQRLRGVVANQAGVEINRVVRSATIVDDLRMD